MAHILQREHVVVDHDLTTLQSVGAVLQRVVYFLLNVALVVLATRFLLRLFGANPVNDFVNFIYALTAPLAVPFSGIFRPATSNAVAAFEVSTLMAVYAVLAYALARLIGILTTTEE